MPVSATLAIHAETVRRRRAGLPVVPLGFGEAGLPVHPLLIAELSASAGSAGYGPVAGIPELREAAAGYWARRGLPTDPEQIVAGPGSKPLLWAVLGARGGDVVVPKPSWVSYAAQAAMHGMRCHAIATRPGQGGVPDPELLDAVARTSPIAAVVLTLPDNPTGTLAAHSTIREVCEIAREHDLLIVSDEIYRDMVHDEGHQFLSPASVVPDRVVVTTGLSKNLALGGWRIGVARFVDAALRDRVIDMASEVWSAPTQPVQRAAALAFSEPAELRERISLSRRLHARVAGAVAGIVGTAPPHGGFYVYPDCSGFDVWTDVELAAMLLSRYGIAALPGSAFGDDPVALRLRLATSLLYGDTDAERLEALHSAVPETLPWISTQLNQLRKAFDGHVGPVVEHRHAASHHPPC